MKNHSRITFICGSLEPGKDGVGDYVLRLGHALVQQGLTVSLLAFYDRHVNEVINTSSHINEKLTCCRLPRKMTNSERIKSASNFIEIQKPDWISLQYVPYAFHTQGIPFHLPSMLYRLKGESKIHLMLHESHLGGKLSLKNNLVRVGQIWIVKQLLSLLQPAIIHTSNNWYQSRLNRIGIKAEILGLFGNIPIIEKKSAPSRSDDKIFAGVYFGIVPQEKDWQAFGAAINSLEGKMAPFKITFVGNLGSLGDKFILYIQKTCKNILISADHAGIMPVEELSKSFQDADFGVTRVSPHLIGKSGSTIALLEHGLKLWVPLALNQSEILKWNDYRVNQCYHDLSHLIKQKEIPKIEPRIDAIARELKEHFVN